VSRRSRNESSRSSGLGGASAFAAAAIRVTLCFSRWAGSSTTTEWLSAPIPISGGPAGGDQDVSNHPKTSGSPSIAMLVMYSLPVVGTTMLISPAFSLVPGIYASRYGLSMASVGAVLLIVRVFDAIFDPLIGMMDDRTKAARGTRKPWIAAGAIVCALGALLLYSPPQHVTVITLFVGSLVLYIGWSTFEIPHNAWVTNLSPDYAGRTRAFALRAVAYYIGGMVTFAIPLLVPGANGQYSSAVLLTTWAISAAIIMLGTLVALARVPDPPASVVTTVVNLKQGWRAVLRNGPLRLFIAAYVVSGFGFGMALTLNYVYMQSVVGLAGRIPLVYVLSSPAALLGIAVWSWLGGRYGKRFVWVCVTTVAALIFLAFFVVPRTPASFPLILGLNLLLFFTLSGIGVASPAALADIVDFGRLHFGEDMGATYYAFYMMIVKASIGVAGGIGFALAGAFGFEAQVATHSAASTHGFMLAFSIVPAALTLLAIPLILAQPIHQRRHAVIVRALQRRAEQTLRAAGRRSVVSD
jgi:Na+/melibiose symporter-like transporter